MEHRLSARVGIALAGVAVAAFGLGTAATIGHAEVNIPGINSCPNGNVYVAEYEGGNPQQVNTLTLTGGAAINQAALDADGNPTGSNVGDTVIVCPGTYTGVAASLQKTETGDDGAPDTSKDNITIRSFSGPGNTILVTDGTHPAFTVDANGATIGGPALGFTIENPASGVASPLVEVGTPGGQSTANEDEQCTTAGGVVTASGCDKNAPAYVGINDRVVDNLFTKLVPANSTTDVTGIELDNTINATVESNLFTNDVPAATTIGDFRGILVGTNFQGAGSNCTDPCNGYSTNINTALFQNAFRQVFGGNNSGCATANGISLDGYVLDSQVYNNLIQQFLTNTHSSCTVAGIESDAFGQLENEQTGTLVPTNGNIDNNTINQVGATRTSGIGILLDPTPPAASSENGQVLGQNPPAPVPGSTCETGMTTPTGTCSGEAAPPSSFTVQDNQLQNLGTAVDVADPLGSNSYAHDNNFQSDVVGVADSATTPNGSNPPTPVQFDATNDFWGCDDGPVPTTGDADDSSCAKISGPVQFNPWLNSRVEQAGDEAGDNAGQS